ncbi:TPA: hypothetical protein U1Z55_001049 [Streptococcus suis]|nr:hypothetical protein [Streptococcus suis]
MNDNEVRKAPDALERVPEMLDTPPNRYHCISKTPQQSLGAFLLPEFQKIAFFQNSIEKYLLLSRTFLKIAVFVNNGC